MAKDKLSLKEGLGFIFNHLPSRFKFYLGITAVLIASVLNAMVPYLYGRLIDLAVKIDVSLSSVISYIVLWISLSILAILFERYGEKKSYELTIDLSNNLTGDLYSHLINLPIAFYKEKELVK